MPDAVAIVDAHVHFWDPRVLSYPWLARQPRLNRPRLPEHFGALQQGTVEQVVFVEANCSPAQAFDEMALIDDMASAEPRIVSRVAYADVTRGTTTTTRLAALARYAGVTGIRHNIQGHPRGFASSEAFIAGVQSVAEHQLCFDLCVTADQLDEAILLVSECPGARFVLDHCGKPSIHDHAFAPWAHQIERMAAHDGVVCKVSGLLTEAAREQWNPELLRPYVEHVKECFGAHRMMYGSDWPVVDLAGGEPLWRDIVSVLVADWSETERDAFYRQTAIRTYRMVQHVGS